MTEADEDAKRIADVEKALGEPVFIGFDEKTSKIRTTMFAVSVVAIVYVKGNLKIDESSSFLGLKFDNLTDELFGIGLLAILIYLLVHFLWNSFDAFLEWRLRLTGTNKIYARGAYIKHDHIDYADNPRQSTLHNWWLYEAKELEKLNTRIAAAQAATDSANQYVEENSSDPDIQSQVNHLQRTVSQAQDQLSHYSTQRDKLQVLYGSPRIAVSLKRFDRWFELFLRSQNLRWITFEFSLPVIMAGYAIYLIWPCR